MYIEVLVYRTREGGKILIVYNCTQTYARQLELTLLSAIEGAASSRARLEASH